MIQKIEKVLDLVAEALSLYIDDARARRGEALPLKEKEAPEKAPRKARAPKAEAAPAPTSPFGTLPVEEGEKKPTKVAVEDHAEAKRRCTEVMGLFIRRYLKSQPSGLDRAKAILGGTLGRQIAKLEDLTHDDNVKLIPVFEAELEKADAK